MKKNNTKKITQDVQLAVEIEDFCGRLKLNDDGFGDVFIPVLTAGVYQYYGWELPGMGFDHDQIVNVLRREDEIMTEATLCSFRDAPIVIGHPWEGLVTIENWDDLAVGHAKSKLEFISPQLWQDIRFSSKEALASIASGDVYLSAGLIQNMIKTSGVWTNPNTGEEKNYDVEAFQMRCNHFALVKQGRANVDTKIVLGDSLPNKKWFVRNDKSLTADAGSASSNKQPSKIRNITMDTKQVYIGDKLDVYVVSADAEKLENRLKELDTSHKTALEAKQTSMDELVGKKDKEIKELTEKVAELEPQVLSADKMDERISQRNALIETAKTFDENIKTDGLSDRDIMTTALCTKLDSWTADSAKDFTDEYVTASFDSAAELLKDKTVARTVDSLTGTPLKSVQTSDASQGHLSRILNGRQSAKETN